MSVAMFGGLLAGVDPAPAPSPTARVLEDWEVTPGLAGFLATFAVAVAAVVLFLSLSRHLRKADSYARAHGIEVPERRGLAVRRGAGAGGDAAAGTPTSPDVASGTAASPDDGDGADGVGPAADDGPGTPR